MVSILIGPILLNLKWIAIVTVAIMLLLLLLLLLLTSIVGN